MSGRISKRIAQFSFFLLLTSFAGLPAGAAEAASSAAELNMNDLKILEHRYFSHGYSHDPVEKRLERLECLIFGSTREGNNNQRLARLMKTVAERSQQSLPSETAKAQTPSQSNSASKTAGSSKQYPVLNTLEWRALKKTFPDETLDQRLERLESKLFGQPAQSMAYIDRVERLQKTLGIGISPEPTGSDIARGPMPKARPRSEDPNFNISPFPEHPAPTPRAMTPFPYNSSPFAAPMLPPGFDSFFDTSFGGTKLQQLFQSMDKQMAELHRLGPGVWIQDPRTKDFIEQNTGRRVSPDGRPRGSINPTRPGIGNDEFLRELPGYADPNSI